MPLPRLTPPVIVARRFEVERVVVMAAALEAAVAKQGSLASERDAESWRRTEQQADAMKAEMRVKEEIQREECARQQKELFREAKLKMEQEMRSHPGIYFESNHQFYGSP